MANSILSLKYPSDINEGNGNEDKYANRRVIFMAMPGEPVFEDQQKFYKSTKFSDLSKIQDQEIKAIISLPIPSSLSDSQSHEWSQDSIQSMIASITGEISPNKSGGGASSGMVKGIGTIAKIGKIINKAKDYGSYALGNRKPMLKPGYFQNYKSSGLRSFSFTYTFIPESKKEAEEIRKIISTFKTLSSPSSYGSKSNTENLDSDDQSFFSSVASVIGKSFEDLASIGVMLAPFVWQIVVTNEKVNNMLQLKTCTCTNVSVTYGDDKFDCFEDGMPKKILLTLSFSEVQLQYAENYAKNVEELTNEFNMNPAEFRSSAKNLFNGISIDSISEGTKSLINNTEEENKNAGIEAGKKLIDTNASFGEKTQAFLAVGVSNAREVYDESANFVRRMFGK